MAANNFDVIVVGVGIAGMTCMYQLATKHKGIKVLGIETGKKFAKRRLQMSGAMGLLPSGDGKLYQNDLSKVADLTSLRQAKSAHTVFKKLLGQITTLELIKDRSPLVGVKKKLNKLGYDIQLNDYTQLYPKDIHALSKHVAGIMEMNKNIHFSFDNHVLAIHKQKNAFIVSCEDEKEYRCKKLVIAVGRAGWRWARDLYQHFGIIESNDIARFGIRIEANSNLMKDFNHSNCTITKPELEIGPLSWNGTIIPEDHSSTAITAFRSNEDRWKTDKVSFNLIGDRVFFGGGYEQMDRLSKLTFLIANDRILKERVSSIVNGRSKLCIMKEYDWLKPVIQELATIIPNIDKKAYFYAPTIIPSAPQINIGSNLETEVKNMFVIGESSGIHGILSAALTGIIAADEVAK